MGTSRGRYLAELRRSGAAGIQDSRPTRSELKQQAIKEEVELSVLFMDDYRAEEYVPGLDDIDGPSDDDLKDIDDEPIFADDDPLDDLYPYADYEDN